jgi:ATPase family associated with various cellular activities (AAA)
MEVSNGSSVEITPEPVNAPISLDDVIVTGDSVVRHDTKSGVLVRETTTDTQDVVKESGEQAGDEKLPPEDPMKGKSSTAKPPSSPLGDPQAEYSKLHERLSRLEDRVGDVETGIKRIEDNDSSDNDSSDDGASDNDASHTHISDNKLEIEIEEKEGGLSHTLRTIPEVRECNWEQFKNRFCEKDGSYAIETLLAGAKLHDEIVLEQLRRSSPEQRARFGKTISDLMENCNLGSQVGDRWIQRIRIQSFPVLKILGKVAGESWSTHPRTFFRPFRLLIYLHDKMKDEFSKLKSKFGETECFESSVKSSTAQDQSITQIPEPNIFTAHGNGEIPLSTMEGEASPNKPQLTPLGEALELSDELSIDALVNSKEAFEDMRCYVNFVDEKLIPLYHQFDKPDNTHPQKIRFDDLWYLFRIGELIYFPNLSESDTSRLSSVNQRVWRLCSLYPPPVIYEVKSLKDKKGRLQLPQTTIIDPTRKSWVYCYYIDSNGESYSAVIKDFTIPYFEGERDIRELDVYPLRFAEDRERIVEELQLQGRNFMRYETERPLSYNGWTLISDPKGNPIYNLKGEVIRYPEHIDSDVIVDFKEAFQTYPPWNPEFGPRPPPPPSARPGPPPGARPSRPPPHPGSLPPPPPPPPPPHPHWIAAPQNTSPSIGKDRFPIYLWSDSKRSEHVASTWEAVVENDNVDSLERTKYFETDQYLVKRGGKQTLSEDDIVLLPKRLFAYALRERKFVHVDVRYLKPITEHIDGFKSLKIDDDHRRMIQSLVHFHFKKKAIEKQGREIGTQDLIRGKGKGLVILLHGVPGVGKTATAEAVAQANKKPLFPITCGDLGFTPESVENSLNEIFRLAHLWDCVLLLDEADIFLSQRTKSDLQRNALVSG